MSLGRSKGLILQEVVRVTYDSIKDVCSRKDISSPVLRL
ncbi:hypothetical protein OROMI_006947 [Orobanche minor]